MSMKHEGVKDDLKKMKELIEMRMHWIWHRDMRQQNDLALTLFEESL